MGVISDWCLEPSAEGGPTVIRSSMFVAGMPALAILPFIRELFMEGVLNDQH